MGKIQNRVYSVDYVNEVIKTAKKEGMLVSYNHPVWSNQNYADYSGLKGLWGVEWYNTGCVVGSYHDTIQPIEDLYHENEFVVPLATDDAHNIGHCFGGWSVIKAKSLSYDDVFSAMAKGDMYSSSGPEIKSLYIEDGVVNVETSDAKEIAITTERRWTRTVQSKDGNPVTSAQFDINGYVNDTVLGGYKSLPYFRITVVDKEGNHAYTRAYRLSEIYDNKWVEKE